jgi:hypothetical protein
VKKIIGILVALGLVLSLTVMAMPVAAKVTQPQVSLEENCACTISGYNITFNITASLTEGVHCVCVKFPAGTTVPTEFETGDIKIEGADVFGSEVTVSGTTVCFLPPADYTTGANPILVEFDSSAGIVNPCIAGKYKLEVYTCREPDSTPVLSAPYTIVPCISDYIFAIDFSPTYPGINSNFVPPFKACGQNDTGQDYDTTYNSTIEGWLSGFNLTFEADPVGCNAPCGKVDIYMSLVAAPQFPCDAAVDPVANVTLELDGNWYTLTYDECTMDEPDKTLFKDNLVLATNTSVTWEGMLHFDTVGEYTICFWAECPGAAGAPCQPPTSGEAAVVVETCFDFDVYQWKDATKLTLREKWNLISLPLVPLGEQSVGDALASIPAADLANILSVWYYDRCEDEWLVWGNGQSSLKSLDDGKAYWMRLAYPLTGCGNVTWWVWGTAKPVPPASPAEYPVCEGWNMVGFTSLTATTAGADTYLWNWGTPDPVVYGWTPGCWTSQGWSLVDFATGNLVPGQGYWVAFPADGAVYQP